MRIGFFVVAGVVALSNAVPFVEAAIRGANNRRVEQHVQVYRDENGDEVIQSGNVKVHVAQNGDELIEIGKSHNVVQKKSSPAPPAPVPTAPTIPPAPTTPPPTPNGPDGNPSCDLCGGIDASGNGFQLDHVPSDRTNELVDTKIAGPMPCGGLEFAISVGNAATPEQCVQYQQNVGSTCCSNKPVASAVEAGIPATKTASEIENFVLKAEGKEGADEETQVQEVPAHTTSTKVFHKEDGDNVKINSFHVAEGKKDGDEELNVQGRPSAADLCRCDCAVPDCLPIEYITSCEFGSVGCTMTCGNVPTCGGGGTLAEIDAVPCAPTDEIPANEFGYEVNAVGDQHVP